MLHGMWFLWKGSAAKVRALVASLQFTLQRRNDEAAAAALARELDAQEVGARIDRESGRTPVSSTQPSTSVERGASDG